jgi:hypothetical protein
MEFASVHKADIALAAIDIRYWGVKRTSRGHAAMSANDPKWTRRGPTICSAYGATTHDLGSFASSLRTIDIWEMMQPCWVIMFGW